MAARFRNLAVERVLGRKVLVAAGFHVRLLGLAYLDRSEAVPLLIPRCRSVHTFGMRFDLDLVFLDTNGDVCAYSRSVSSRRFAFCGRASAVLEIPAEQGGESCTVAP